MLVIIVMSLTVGIGVSADYGNDCRAIAYCGKFELDFGGDINAEFFVADTDGPFVILHGFIDLPSLPPGDDGKDGPVFWSGTGQRYGKYFIANLTMTQRHIRPNPKNCWRDGRNVQFKLNLTRNPVRGIYWSVGTDYNPCEYDNDPDPDSDDGFFSNGYDELRVKVAGKLPNCLMR